LTSRGPDAVRPVVADRRREVGGLPQRLLDPREMPGRVEAGRPVPPQPVNERQVVGGYDLLGGGQRIPEEEQIEKTLDLLVVAEQQRIQCESPPSTSCKAVASATSAPRL